MNSMVPRNVFDLSHGRKLSCSMGKLLPVFLMEILPGDYVRCMSSVVVRFGALLRPLMHKVDVFLHFYWVPNRMVWTDFEKFISGGEDGLDATAAPYITLAGPIAEGSLDDLLGIPIYYTDTPAPNTPTAFVSPITVSALPYRVYDLIYNEHYRNMNHQAKKTISLGNGADTTTYKTLISRNWEKDYFTGQLPWAQRGSPVMLPLGTSAPVKTSSSDIVTGTQQAMKVRKTSDGNVPGDYHLGTYGAAGTVGLDASGFTVGDSGGMYPSNLYADLQNATAATVNVIRQAFQVQRWLEKNARVYGGRYVELLKEHFGVTLDDYRAMRPVFLGGDRAPVVVSEVLQTSETTENSPQGNLAGHAFSVANGMSFKSEFNEHGFVMGILSIMPRTAYQQGLHRMWKRTSKYDYYWPTFAHLGYRAVPKMEIYCDGDTGDSATFGYIPPWDEYRFLESSVHGQFKSSMDNWHLARKFTSRPTLGDAFITADPDDRIFAVSGEDNIMVQVWHDVKAVRAMPLVGEPGMIDH